MRQEDTKIYSPEESDNWPSWKKYALNFAVASLFIVFVASFILGIYEIIIHPWIIPIILVPLLIWMFYIFIKNA